jgi:hypothetical protein
MIVLPPLDQQPEQLFTHRHGESGYETVDVPLVEGHLRAVPPHQVPIGRLICACTCGWHLIDGCWPCLNTAWLAHLDGFRRPSQPERVEPLPIPADLLRRVADALRGWHRPVTMGGEGHSSFVGEAAAFTHCVCWGAMYRVLDAVVDDPEVVKLVVDEARRRGTLPPLG